MLEITKIFHFETAHALHGYNGPCQHIHGHSYTLHVTVAQKSKREEYLAAPGILIDFKELKQIVNKEVINKLDHALLLSKAFLAENAALEAGENLFIMEAEPSAENLLIFIQRSLAAALPAGIRLSALKLFETADSYVTWSNDDERKQTGKAASSINMFHVLKSN